jgi:tetratricopeptide (TPR) repeat protein
VRVDLGTCYRNAGKPDVAVKEYRKAVEINPNHLTAHKNLGIVFAYDLRDKTQAISEFEKVLQIAPNASDAAQVQQELQKLKSSK